MDNQDTLYKQFQDASQKASEKDFQSMEKVWARVEEKLDKKALTKETQLWKKIAVAASVLLAITLGSNLLLLENKEEIKQKEEVITHAPLEKEKALEDRDAIVTTEGTNPIIKENAAAIVTDIITKNQDYVANEEASEAIASDTLFTNLAKLQPNEVQEKEESNGNNFKRKIQPAIGVQRNDVEIKANKAMLPEVQKLAPLYVVDGKAVTVTKNDAVNANIHTDDATSIEYLSEPLYIINGIEYSEEALFGPNPTSPYSPLNRQEIVSTTILQGLEATSIYGEKGKKGVVIISTKNGKPAQKRQQK